MKMAVVIQKGILAITYKMALVFFVVIGFLVPRIVLAAPFVEQERLVGAGIKVLDEFGNSVAISGNTALVGAHANDAKGFNAGSAFVFTRNAAGVWTQQIRLNADDPAPHRFFGYSVAIDGDTALIGANGNDEIVPVPPPSEAYVFTRNPATGVWTQQQKLTAADGVLGDDFGSAVSLSGNTALVGAFGHNNGSGPSSGAAYVFTRDPATGTWSQQTKLVASDTKADEFFGNAVAIHGETAVIGAVGNDEVTLSGLPGVPGSAYVFTRNGAGAWTQQAKLTPVGGMPLDFFGISVAVHGDTTLIGANGDDRKGVNAGLVYAFTRNPTTGIWNQQILSPSDAVAYDLFGISVSVSGNTALVGAMGDELAVSVEGSAYTFTRDSETGAWSQQDKLSIPQPTAVGEPDAEPFSLFGVSVSMNNNIALVGASQVPIPGTGAAYIYEHAPHSEPEVCDGKDNDLDGQIDDGFPNMDSDAMADCTDADDDGDGVSDVTDNCLLVVNPIQTDSDRDGLGDVCDSDDDGDGVLDIADNCPLTANADQANLDRDRMGNACDPDDDGDGVADTADNCPLKGNAGQTDTDRDKTGDDCDLDDDGDGVADTADNCPATANTDQMDSDHDGKGDPCDDSDNDGVVDTVDNCPATVNPGQTDVDGDKTGDACDLDLAETDGDGVADIADNCPSIANRTQTDTDHDGKGNACDPDDDGDGVMDTSDNCPVMANADQADADRDGRGDLCDDSDSDGVMDTTDNCPLTANTDQADVDGDKIGNACDLDNDGDGVADTADNCPVIANTDQADVDGDKVGNVCDFDNDGDAVVDTTDNCPTAANANQTDADKDGIGDLCDDSDHDGVTDTTDNCPLMANTDQVDTDRDGLGNLCDPVDDKAIVAENQNTPPPASQLVFPPNGGMGVSLDIILQWKKVADLDRDRVSYTVCLKPHDNQFGSDDCKSMGLLASLNKTGLYAGLGVSGTGLLLFGFVLMGGPGRHRFKAALLIVAMALIAGCGSTVEKNTPGAFIPGTAHEGRFVPSRLDPNTTYYWKVISNDGRGGTNTSEVSNFTTRQ
jgi:hypothetical protein